MKLRGGVFAVLVGVVASACAQPPAAPRAVGQDVHDALRYWIEMQLDLEKQHLQGVVRYEFAAVEALDCVTLDAVRTDEWHVEFRDASGAQLATDWDDDRVVVKLGREVARGDKFTFEAHLSGVPADGFYFGKSRHGDVLAFTDHYSIRARGWLPCEDHPGDRAAFRVTVVYPVGNRAVASGSHSRSGPVYDTQPGFAVLDNETQSDIPPYMLAFAVGPYVEVKEGGDERLRPHLVYRQDEELAKRALVHHAEWMRTMEATFGPYPYAKYMVFQCPTRWGGFEAPGNVQISEGLFDSPRGVAILAHELVHMWFGDGVGYAEWREVWLSEGFASYFGPWLWAKTGGPPFVDSLREMRDRWLNSADGRTKTIRWDGFAHPDVALNTNTYQKGAWVLHMLRGELGDGPFFAALKSYFGRHAGTSVFTVDLVQAVEESSGRDLSWFFGQWLDRVGCPELRATLVQGEDGAVVRIEQLQGGEPYRLRVPVQWVENGEPVTRIVPVVERITEVGAPGAIGPIVIDPNAELLFRPRR